MEAGPTVDGVPPLLDVAGLSTGYDDTPVLNDVRLSVRPSETVALLGPNGHGKTTLLRTICGLHRPWSGRVFFEAREITGKSANRVASLGLIYVPQGDLLFPDMTVGENLLVGAYVPRAWRARRARLRAVWDMFPQLEERKDQLTRSLSGGERRMVAIGRGLMGEAKLLMIDEPSLGLAPVAIDGLYQALERLAASGMPILLVEEAAERIGTIADRVYLLDSGAIVREGAAEIMLGDRAMLDAYLG
jgi:branched-chain amino acid transport system ATP-binding protein